MQSGSPIPPAGSLIPTLEGSWYTSAEVFARERQAIFDCDWLCAARADDILAPGRRPGSPVRRRRP